MKTIDHGLIVDNSTTPPTCCGYIFNFPRHGAFAPDGKVKVGGAELTQEQIDTHNRLLGQAEWEAMLKRGRGVLYVSKSIPSSTGSHFIVGNWAGTHKVNCSDFRKSFHNMAGRDGRTDVWFYLDGSRWHGVNIGDNDICRVRRCKS